MKQGLVLVIASLVALGAASTARGDTGWHLVWSDEFDGPSLDPSSWTGEVGDGSPQNPGWGNAEAEFSTTRPENLSIAADGPLHALRITARSERFQGKYYTSARIKIQGKRSFAFGRVEARIRLPRGKGMWPAFWMMGESFSATGWPACGEIDIMEMRGGNDNVVLGTMHWQDADGRHAASIPGVARLEAGEWGQKFFLILNLAVGGHFLSNQIPPLGFTHESMDVDWVRWYQKN